MLDVSDPPHQFWIEASRPIAIYFTPELPQRPTGKILRRVLCAIGRRPMRHDAR